MASLELHGSPDIKLGLSVGQLQNLLDGLTDAAVVIDAKLHIVAWNARYVQQLGIRGNKFRRAMEEHGPRCRDFLGLDICDTGCLAARVFETRRPVRVDEIRGRIAVRHEQVGELNLIVSTVPIFDAEGRPVAALETYRDVTAEARIQERYKVLLEAERRRAELLEEQVRLRTADLERSLEELKQTRAQLIHSEKLSSLGQLVAGLAHELNNPINFIYGNVKFLQDYVGALLKVTEFLCGMPLAAEHQVALEALKQELDFDYVKQDIGNVISSMQIGAERVSGIIRDLRRFIHGGSIERVLVDLPRCVDMALHLLTHELKGRNDLVRDYEPNLPMVLGNEGQLSQVFMNLVVNALQAMKGLTENGPRGKVIVRVCRRDRGVVAEVIDNGVGIPEDIQLKVFDPFFTTKPVGEGTGMGLAIAYSIVNNHGGKLSLTSKMGVGTTFTVWLPVTDEQAMRPTEPTP